MVQNLLRSPGSPRLLSLLYFNLFFGFYLVPVDAPAKSTLARPEDFNDEDIYPPAPNQPWIIEASINCSTITQKDPETQVHKISARQRWHVKAQQALFCADFIISINTMSTNTRGLRYAATNWVQNSWTLPYMQTRSVYDDDPFLTCTQKCQQPLSAAGNVSDDLTDATFLQKKTGCYTLPILTIPKDLQRCDKDVMLRLGVIISG